MSKPLTNLEVRKALFDMNPSKAPEPDGFQSLFYQRFWDTVRPDVTNVVLDSMNNQILPLELNETSLVLIPKLESMKHF